MANLKGTPNSILSNLCVDFANNLLCINELDKALDEVLCSWVLG